MVLLDILCRWSSRKKLNRSGKSHHTPAKNKPSSKNKPNLDLEYFTDRKLFSRQKGLIFVYFVQICGQILGGVVTTLGHLSHRMACHASPHQTCAPITWHLRRVDIKRSYNHTNHPELQFVSNTKKSTPGVVCHVNRDMAWHLELTVASRYNASIRYFDILLWFET